MTRSNVKKRICWHENVQEACCSFLPLSRYIPGFQLTKHHINIQRFKSPSQMTVHESLKEFLAMWLWTTWSTKGERNKRSDSIKLLYGPVCLMCLLCLVLFFFGRTRRDTKPIYLRLALIVGRNTHACRTDTGIHRIVPKHISFFRINRFEQDTIFQHPA